jgi:hypothetical protein
VRPRAVAKRGQLIAKIGCGFAADMRRNRDSRIAVDTVAGSALAGDFLAGDGIANRKFVSQSSPGEQKPAENGCHCKPHSEGAGL